jgi:hypothetical protein
MRRITLFAALCLTFASVSSAVEPLGLTISWEKNFLTIRGEKLPGREMKVNYIEAYCRPGSTDRDWGKTVIGHMTERLSAGSDGKSLELKSTLNDGVTVQHLITAGDDEIDFRLTAHNPTKTESLVHWAQPCIRVGEFTGLDKEKYVTKCFVFLDGELTRMPTPNWATKARYVPGQVWCPKHVNRDDVNPRPLNEQVPSNGLIATAFEPYQELFQGVAHCIHSDFRIGGLKPGETKRIRGKIYYVSNDVPALLRRYARDFPEQTGE